MYNLALLGKNISHSQSPRIYHELLDGKVQYKLFDFESESSIPTLDKLFSDNLKGLSITAPYKKHFLKNVKIQHPQSELKAINCIKKVGTSYHATNTDFLALKEILTRMIEECSFERILLLGAGSMAEISKMILNEMNQEYLLFSRKQYGDLSNLDLEKFSKSKNLILNSCSRDMQFAGKLSPNTTFFDFNYQMKHSETIADKSNLIKYIDGMELLYLQAKYAIEFWEIS